MCKGRFFPQVPRFSPLPRNSHLLLYILVMTTGGAKDISYITCLKIKDKALITAESRKKEMWLRKLRFRDQIPRTQPHPECMVPDQDTAFVCHRTQEVTVFYPPQRPMVKHSPRETHGGLICLEDIIPFHSSLR